VQKNLDNLLMTAWASSCLYPAHFLLGEQDQTSVLPGMSSHCYAKQRLDAPRRAAWFRCAALQPRFFPW